MSLFGNKPPSTKPSVFTFGSTPAATTNAPLFGSTTTANKPLFPSTTSTAPLFGSVTATSAPPLFGSTTTSLGAPPPGSLFSSTAGSTAPTAPLFGSTTTAVTKPLFGSTTNSGPLFGSTTTSSGPLFGASTSGSLFGPTSTPSSFSTAGGLFGSKPVTTGFSFPSTSAKPGGIFNANATQAASVQTLQDVIQNSESLVRSLTAPDLYGDERDVVMGKLNQLLAACGIGSGYYKADQPPIAYHINGPFYRFKAIGYNRRSEYREGDGIVALTLNVNYDQLSSNAQRQKLIDALNIIVGNNTNVRTHIETIRPLPDENSVEVLIYVTEKGKGRIPCKELSAYFKQPSQDAQLKSQLCVTDVVVRSSMDDAKLRFFLETPPAGFDAQVWKQAIRDNPDVDRLIPYPIRGFEQLRKRQKLQSAEISLMNKAVEALKQRVVSVTNEVASGSSRYSVCRQRQKELSYRFLRCFVMQILVQRYSIAVDVREERLESRLETINAALVAPNQVKSRVANLLDILRSNSDALKTTQDPLISLKDSEAAQLKKYLSRCQQALETIVSVVNNDLEDLKIMSSQF